MPTWSTISGYTSTSQFEPITDTVTDANANYMQTNVGSHVLTIVNRLNENSFRKKATATNGDTTPTVDGISKLFIGQAVTITDFDDAIDMQELRVIATVSAVVITGTNNAIIRLPLDLNITLNANDYLDLESDGSVWHYRGHYNF